MKASGGCNPGGKDRKRKICDQATEQERTKVPQSASRRHREKINATLEELGSLLPLPEDARSKLDKLTVLKLSVSFFQTQNYLQSGKRKRGVDDASVSDITKKLEELNINVSDISLEALDSFFLVLSDSGDVFFASENVYRYLGYTQTYLMHQNFLNFVHQEDVVGFERCLRRSARARIIELENGTGLDCQELEDQPIPQVCFCSIKCHAGRQSSHVSPFYYRSFKFDGKIKPLLNGKKKQFGFFSLVTPVNPANPFTSTPKELLQSYSCKMALDLRIRKLDTRGQKSLYYPDKEAVNMTGYMVAHPDDIPSLLLAHQQITATGVCEIVFRLKNGQGVFQWIRGKARTLYDKNNQPEAITADNVLLNDEQGPYFRKVCYEALLEWKSRQKGLPSPPGEEDYNSRLREIAQEKGLKTPSPPQGNGLPTGAVPPSVPPHVQNVPDEPRPVDLPYAADRSYPPPVPNGRLSQGISGAPSGAHTGIPTTLGGSLSSNRPVPASVPCLATSRESGSISGQGITVIPDEVLLDDSKDIEIIDFANPTTVAEPSGPKVPTFDLTSGSPESCMFRSAHLNRQPLEVKPNLAHSGTGHNFKTENRNDSTHVFSKRSKSAHEQIHRIKQFLMGEEANSLTHLPQADNTGYINGGSIHDVPDPWAGYPVDTSPVLPEVNFPDDDDECLVNYPQALQREMRPTYQPNEYTLSEIVQGNVTSTQFVGTRQPDTDNLIYPFLPDTSSVSHGKPSNAFVNGMGKRDIHLIPTTIDGLPPPLHNGQEFNPAFRSPEGTLPQSHPPRYQHNHNGLHLPQRGVGFNSVIGSTPANQYSLDLMLNSNTSSVPRQDTSLWYSSPKTTNLAQNMPPTIDDMPSVDELTPSLYANPTMAPYANPTQFHNGHISESVQPTNAFHPPNGMHLNQPGANKGFQKQTFQNEPGDAKKADPNLQQGGNSLLRMMLTL